MENVTLQVVPNAVRVFRVGSVPLSDDGPMIAQLPYGPDPDTYWLLRYATCSGWLASQPCLTNPPATAISIVDSSVPPESLAQAQSTSTPSPGINLQSRGAVLDCDIDNTALGSGWAFICATRVTVPVPVIPGQTVRFTGSSVPGNAAPGPGANSVCELVVFVEIVKVRTVTA